MRNARGTAVSRYHLLSSHLLSRAEILKSWFSDGQRRRRTDGRRVEEGASWPKHPPVVAAPKRNQWIHSGWGRQRSDGIGLWQPKRTRLIATNWLRWTTTETYDYRLRRLRLRLRLRRWCRTTQQCTATCTCTCKASKTRGARIINWHFRCRIGQIWLFSSLLAVRILVGQFEILLTIPVSNQPWNDNTEKLSIYHVVWKSLSTASMPVHVNTGERVRSLFNFAWCSWFMLLSVTVLLLYFYVRLSYGD